MGGLKIIRACLSLKFRRDLRIQAEKERTKDKEK